MNEVHEQLMAMKIGEGKSLLDEGRFLRVPGGWVFYRHSEDYGPTCCFIPLSEAKKELEQPHD